jgi:hypothetical protein
MLFIDSKYTQWYYNIITRAKVRNISAGTHTKKNHIIPKSLGGTNTKENLVNLTAKEHFICQHLLIKMVNVPAAQEKCNGR